MHESVQTRVLLSLLLLLLSVEAAAQQDTFGRHTASLRIGWIDHVYTGSALDHDPFDFRGMGIGLSYAGPQIRGAGIVARNFLDLSAMTWMLPDFARIDRGGTMVAVPVGLMTAWRRVSARNATAPYSVNAILIGTGGMLVHSLARRARIELRAMPLAGVTGSQIADAVGISWAADAELRLLVADVFSSFGLTVGYTFRYQFWNVNGSRVISDAVDELYDYAGTIHTFSVGGQF